MTYDPVTGEGWDQQEALRAWSLSMARVSMERTAPLRWQMRGMPPKIRWEFFNFGPWFGVITVEADGFCWLTRSYDTGEIFHEGTTTSLYEAYQSVEQNKPVAHP
jgi:hypothetical protein